MSVIRDTRKFRPALGASIVVLVLCQFITVSHAQETCGAQNLQACNAAGIKADREGRVADAVEIFTFACERGLQQACSNAAEYHLDGRGTKQDPAKALGLFVGACKANVESGCAGACVTLFDALGNLLPEFHAKCTQSVQASCSHGNPWMCGKLPILPLALRPANRPSVQQQCEQGSATHCVALGTALYSTGDAREAARYSRRACELGSAIGCSNLGELYYEGAGVPRQLAQARKLFSGACDQGEVSGCAGVCLVAAERPDVWSADAKLCSQHLSLSCKGGNFWMCKQVNALAARAREQSQQAHASAQAATGCTVAETHAIGAARAQIFQLAAQGNLQQSLAVASRLNAQLSPACQRAAAQQSRGGRRNGGISQAQQWKMQNQLRDLERLSKQKSDLFKADVMSTVVSGGFIP